MREPRKYWRSTLVPMKTKPRTSLLLSTLPAPPPRSVDSTCKSSQIILKMTVMYKNHKKYLFQKKFPSSLFCCHKFLEFSCTMRSSKQFCVLSTKNNREYILKMISPTVSTTFNEKFHDKICISFITTINFFSRYCCSY